MERDRVMDYVRQCLDVAAARGDCYALAHLLRALDDLGLIDEDIEVTRRTDRDRASPTPVPLEYSDPSRSLSRSELPTVPPPRSPSETSRGNRGSDPRRDMATVPSRRPESSGATTSRATTRIERARRGYRIRQGIDEGVDEIPESYDLL